MKSSRTLIIKSMLKAASRSRLSLSNGLSDIIFKHAVTVEKENFMENCGDVYYDDYLKETIIENAKKWG